MPEFIEFRVCVALVLCLASACGIESDSSSDPADSADRERAVSFNDAVVTAQEQVPDGIPYEVELEQHEGEEVIEVELFVGNTIREVHINPATGAVISVVDETDGEQSEAELEQQAALMQGEHLSLADAAAAAEEQTGGRALEVEYEVVDGSLRAKVELEDAAGVRVVHLDPASGRIVDAAPAD